MEVTNKEVGYNVRLAVGETIKVLVNDTEYINLTVSPGKEGYINFKFRESIIEQ